MPMHIETISFLQVRKLFLFSMFHVRKLKSDIPSKFYWIRSKFFHNHIASMFPNIPYCVHKQFLKKELHSGLTISVQIEVSKLIQ